VFFLVSQISRDEVAHLARLARLALTDAELDSYAGQLDAILTHVSAIQAVDVTGVQATDNPLKDVNVTRPDEIAAGLTQQQALAAAPRAEDGRFAVPQILGEAQ
jgi:aspartyl-tRNA(Asn)/glutamyl-tRNA(Gln) amidotransferase subunit C